MDFEIRYLDDCPNWKTVDAAIASLVEELGVEASVTHTRVDSSWEAEHLEFRGSPTVLIDSEDPWSNPDAPVGLSCRMYRTEAGFAGTPSESQLRTAIEAAR